MTAFGGCHLHANKIVESTVLNVSGMALLSRLYSFTLFLRTSGYFLRLILSVRSLVRQSGELIIKSDLPSAHDILLNQEAMSYLAGNIWRTTQARRHNNQSNQRNQIHHSMGQLEQEDVEEQRGLDSWVREIVARAATCQAPELPSTSSSSSARRLGKFKMVITKFVCICNGRFDQVAVVHHCWGAGCCSCRADTETRLVEALTSFPLSTVPVVLDARSWTALGPCLDRVLSYMCLYRFAVRLLPVAYGPLSFANATEAPVQQGDVVATDALDEELQKHTRFHAVAGKRYKASKRFFEDPTQLIPVIMLAIVMEPLRYVSAWLMAASRGVEHPCRWPPLVDMMNYSFSPVIHVLQYLAALASGAASRLVMLWAYAGYKSYSEWCRARPGQIRSLRRLLLICSSGVYRKHKNTILLPLAPCCSSR